MIINNQLKFLFYNKEKLKNNDFGYFNRTQNIKKKFILSIFSIYKVNLLTANIFFIINYY